VIVIIPKRGFFKKLADLIQKSYTFIADRKDWRGLPHLGLVYQERTREGIGEYQVKGHTQAESLFFD